MMGHKAILHIFSTFNNVLITATDLTGAKQFVRFQVVWLQGR